MQGTTKTAADSARDYISVVDMDSNAISEILNQPAQTSKPVDSEHRPAESERDGTDGEVGQRSADSSAGPEPSVAELHYNSLFHRDAHPEGK